MSFFNSLQQYVTSGVAGLGLSPRRFSLHRQPSDDPTAAVAAHTAAQAAAAAQAATAAAAAAAAASAASSSASSSFDGSGVLKKDSFHSHHGKSRRQPYNVCHINYMDVISFAYLYTQQSIIHILF